MNSCVESLSSAVGKLTNLYQSAGLSSGPQGATSGPQGASSGLHGTSSDGGTRMTGRPPSPSNGFLSALNFETYYETEDSFSQELTNFTKKQFFEVCFNFSEVFNLAKNSRLYIDSMMIVCYPVLLVVRLLSDYSRL